MPKLKQEAAAGAAGTGAGTRSKHVSTRGLTAEMPSLTIWYCLEPKIDRVGMAELPGQSEGLNRQSPQTWRQKVCMRGPEEACTLPGGRGRQGGRE